MTLIVSDGEAASAPASTTVEVGWNSGSSLVITFSSGTAKREARAFDGDATRAPLLHVEHKVGGTALPE